MQLGNAVDLVAGGKAEVRHADLVVRDDGHVVDLAPVVRVDGAQVLDEAAVDLLTDGVDARQLLPEQVDVPALKRLAHNGVVRVGQRAAGDVPRLVPAEVVLINEQAHQLRHTQGRMGVVDVDGDLFRQVRVGAVFLIVLLQDALQRGGDEQVLLLQAQALALDVVVRRIEDLRDGLGHGVALQRADIVAAGERSHVEALRQLGAPQDEAVGGIAVIAGDIHVIRHGHNGAVADLRDLEAVVVHPLADLAAELDLDGVVLAGLQPHVAHLEPVVREFHLPAVDDLLLEDTELIADGEAGHRVIHAGRGIHIAGGQTAKAAVSKAGVGIDGIDLIDVEACIGQCLAELCLQPKVKEVIAQAGADQELHRHIINFLALLFGAAVAEDAVLLRQQLADADAQRAIDLLLGGVGKLAAENAAQRVVEQLRGLNGALGTGVILRKLLDLLFGILLLVHGAS